MPLRLLLLFAQSGPLERAQSRREVGVPGGRGAARTQWTAQEGDTEETGEPRLAGGEPEAADLTHDTDCSGGSAANLTILQTTRDQVSRSWQ